MPRNKIKVSSGSVTAWPKSRDGLTGTYARLPGRDTGSRDTSNIYPEATDGPLAQKHIASIMINSAKQTWIGLDLKLGYKLTMNYIHTLLLQYLDKDSREYAVPWRLAIEFTDFWPPELYYMGLKRTGWGCNNILVRRHSLLLQIVSLKLQSSARLGYQGMSHKTGYPW
jgi:hypothetical protein